MSYFFSGQLKEAEDLVESGIDICEKCGIGIGSIPNKLFQSNILIAKGQMKQGLKKFEETREVMRKNHLKVYYALSESMLGTVYTQFIIGPSPSLSTLTKNIGFIVKKASFAEKKAEEHFNKAIALFRDMGAKVDLGQALLGQGRLYKAKKRNEKARECFTEAVRLFQECDAHIFLKQVEEELASVVK